MQRERSIDLLEFRGLLVHLEDALPFCRCQRWQETGQRTPVGHRQPRPGQSGKAAQHDHPEYQSTADQEPPRDGAIFRFSIKHGGE